MQTTLQYSSDLSDTELLTKNSAKRKNLEISRYLNSAKQAGLSPQHATTLLGVPPLMVTCWDEAFRLIGQNLANENWEKSHDE